jgi:DnaJ-class molecular chaperone
MSKDPNVNPNPRTIKCPACKGRGQRMVEQRNGPKKWDKCPDCLGTGDKAIR